MIRWFHLLVVVVWPGWVLPAANALDPAAKQQQIRAESSAFFSNPVVYQIRIEIAPEDIAKLRKDPRQFVHATIQEGGESYSEVGLHLKGMAGSFRGVDDPKPGFTLSFSKFESRRKFHGARKIHLNNCVQDASFLNENLAGELFRAAGVPAARVAYALVELNERKLGFYVIKEGISEDFLAQYFKHPNGNLYDMEGGREVTEQMKRQSGLGPLDWSNLKAAAAAAQEPDLTKRWQRLDRVLDLDRFVSFMAMEMITCHWDGYCIGRNNFRIYHDLETDKLVFLPHGMDQMFGDPNYPIRPPSFNGLIAQAVIRTPAGRRLYRERVGVLATNVFKIELLTNRVNDLVAQILPALAVYNTNAAGEFESQAAGLRSRLVQRAAGLAKFLSLPEPKPIHFDNQVAKLTGWRISNDKVGATLEEAKDSEGKQVLRIHATANTRASWRTRVLLEGGHYRFEGQARGMGIIPNKEDKKGEGAGLRISGSQQPRPNKLSGDAPWQQLAYEFEVAAPDDDVELLCELRASSGEVCFDLNSLKLLRVK